MHIENENLAEGALKDDRRQVLQLVRVQVEPLQRVQLVKGARLDAVDAVIRFDKM